MKHKKNAIPEWLRIQYSEISKINRQEIKEKFLAKHPQSDSYYLGKVTGQYAISKDEFDDLELLTKEYTDFEKNLENQILPAEQTA